MREVWKDVKGYEGIYEVSTLGRVRTHKDKTTFTEKHGVRKWKQRILKAKKCKQNSHRVDLWKGGVNKTWLVHRLVALAFIPNTNNLETVNHIDGNRLNNCADNLEWLSHGDNIRHAFALGLYPQAKEGGNYE